MKITTSKPEKVILSAVKKYFEFIAPTYGPAGKKILIVQNEFNHEAVDDGKRSSLAFELEDELENAVIQYIKETTQKGKDGTTTAGILMSNIVLEALKDSEDEYAPHDYHGMVLGLKSGLTEAVKQITKASKKIKTKEELYAIAHNSYNDDKIAKLIADTIFQIGKDGVLNVQDSKSTETAVEIVNGLEIQKGYASPYLVNKLENPIILVVNKKINLFKELFPILTSATPQGGRGFIHTDIVIIAEGFGEDVINNFLAAKITGRVRPLLIEAPGYGDKYENMLDIAAITGATLVDEKLLKLENVTDAHFGVCETVESTKDKTTFLGGAGKTKDYIGQLKGQFEKATNNFEKDKLTQRIAVISGGVAVIKVGAYTENEQKGIKTKVENAVNSTQIAFKGGVVPGAGKALLDIKTSSELLNRALKAPREQLEKNGAQYLDENTSDPSDVIITALESAVSIAGGLLTMGGISVPKRKKEDKELSFN